LANSPVHPLPTNHMLTANSADDPSVDVQFVDELDETKLGIHLSDVFKHKGTVLLAYSVVPEL
jgi:hypothetical protein